MKICENIYSYGQDLRGEGKLLGYGYHFVHIPADYADSKLEIIMHITENDAFSGIAQNTAYPVALFMCMYNRTYDI